MNAVLVIGSGQRVRRAALPAILSRPETWNLAGIRSRKPKQWLASVPEDPPPRQPPQQQQPMFQYHENGDVMW